MNTNELDDQELATVLAAPRYYQMQGLDDEPVKRPDAIHDIAVGGDDGNFICSLDGPGIDALCERMNLPVKVARSIKSELMAGVAGQLFAPNGKRIVASKDWIPGNAVIARVSVEADGTLTIEWDGQTEVCWDGQHTEEENGERIFIDEGGNEWREGELTLKAEKLSE